MFRNYQKCAVPLCSRRFDVNKDVKYFCFPANKERCLLWLRAINNRQLKDMPLSSIRKCYSVCERHFETSQFQTPQRLKLNRNATPTLHLIEEIHGQELSTSSPETPTNLLEGDEKNRELSAPMIQETYVGISTPTNVPLEQIISAPGTSKGLDIIGDEGNRQVSAPMELETHVGLSTPPNVPLDPDISTPSTSKGPYIVSREANRPKTILAEIGVRKAMALTPRKNKLYHEFKRARRSANFYKTKAARRLQGITDLFDKGEINNMLNDKYLNSLQNMSKAGQTFILSQFKRAGKAKKKMPWTASEKAVFIAMFKNSPKGYRLLRRMFTLPSQKTLQRTLNAVPLSPGICDNIFLQLRKMSEALKPIDRQCTLIFDEMAIQPHLDINVKYGCIDGLEDFGSGKSKTIADHVLVFIIRGVTMRWKQPVAYYFVKSGTKSIQLQSLITEIVSGIQEKTLFKVVASICDMGTANQSAIRALSEQSGNPDEYTYLVNDQIIFHIFDPPHLLKCFRNHLLDKDICFMDFVAKWKDIEMLYDLDSITVDSKICPKLTEAHINPTSRQKMRVKFAAQVFSHSVHAALNFATNCKAMDGRGTAHLCSFVDRLFNSLNGVRQSKRPLNGPLTDKSEHIEFWSEAVEFINNLTFKKNGKTVPTPVAVKMWVVTIKNVQKLWNVLRSNGVKYLLTRNLNQDPLENLFGVVRGLSGQNFRPTSLQFIAAYKTCLLNNLIANSNATNCEDDGTDFLIHFLSSEPFSSPASLNVPASEQPTVSDVSDLPVRDLKTFSHAGASYIAGFILKKYLDTTCAACSKYFLTEQCTDSHAFITLKDLGNKLAYPSTEMITLIDNLKKEILPTFLANINKFRIFSLIQSEVNVDSLFTCEKHPVIINKIIISTVFIFVKYIVRIINRKLQLKDLRSYPPIDKYLKQYGPTYYKK